MSEIELLYKNAGVKKEFEKPAKCVKKTYITCDGCMLYDDKKGKCNNKKDYPPFAAEKQLELIKLLMEQEDFSWTIARQGKNTEYAFYVGYEHSSGDFKEFTEALAGIINSLWQDLTDQERTEIADILKG